MKKITPTSYRRKMTPTTTPTTTPPTPTTPPPTPTPDISPKVVMRWFFMTPLPSSQAPVFTGSWEGAALAFIDRVENRELVKSPAAPWLSSSVRGISFSFYDSLTGHGHTVSRGGNGTAMDVVRSGNNPRIYSITNIPKEEGVFSTPTIRAVTKSDLYRQGVRKTAFAEVPRDLLAAAIDFRRRQAAEKTGGPAALREHCLRLTKKTSSGGGLIAGLPRPRKRVTIASGGYSVAQDWDVDYAALMECVAVYDDFADHGAVLGTASFPISVIPVIPSLTPLQSKISELEALVDLAGQRSAWRNPESALSYILEKIQDFAAYLEILDSPDPAVVLQTQLLEERVRTRAYRTAAGEADEADEDAAGERRFARFRFNYAVDDLALAVREAAAREASCTCGSIPWSSPSCPVHGAK